ncbi:MAG: MarR family transcriptional regulator [Clostridiales bacterium]|jgi:DNA-binding MarR family transcriptional regulator|nr:MarR family transcriptional regulator [Clostridiales bacterium]
MADYNPLSLENQLCFPLYAASRKIVRKYKPHLDELGITYTQYIALMVLWEEGPCNVKTLGERLYLDSGTLTPMLKNLEKGGIVTRLRSREDERELVVSLTNQGKRLRERALEVPRKMSACMPLSPDEAATLYRLLYKLLN